MGRRESWTHLLARGGQEGARPLSWKIHFIGSARRELKRLDQQNRERVVAAIERLAEDEMDDVTRLTNVTPIQWRLRVGPWRVLFAYRPEENELLVLRVLPRGKAYDR